MTAVGESTRAARRSGSPARTRLREQLGELEFLISPDAFFQTNTEMAERLYGMAVEFASLRGTERVFDLYCGIGTIALVAGRARPRGGRRRDRRAGRGRCDRQRPPQRDHERVVLRRRHPSGAARARRAARASRTSLLVDPPRAGLSQKIVRRIVEAGPRRIVYVSCNPTTLAPNAAQLTEAGYRLTRVRPVDMFPQTPHIECVALLERT